MGQLILVCGMSGSGKSTYCAELCKTLGNYKYINIDNYYKKINGSDLNHVNFFDVWIEVWKDLHKFELAGDNVIVDTNAITISQRGQFVDWFPTYEHHMIWVHCKPSLCLKNNSKRDRIIPLSKMNAIFSKVQEPNDKTECKEWVSIKKVYNIKNSFKKEKIIRPN